MRVYTQGGWSLVNVLDGSITEDKLANGAVTAQKITLNNSLFPTANIQFDLGSTTSKFKHIYTENITTGDLNLKSNEGDWTVIEQANFIKLRNNNTGQEFSITMEAL